MASAKTSKTKKEAPATKAKSAKPGEAPKATTKAAAAPAAKGGEAIILGSAALQHGKGAYGARYVKPGFALTEEDDLAFALGYPHFFIIADGHPDDADPEKNAPLYISKHDLEPPVWPREVAVRVARGFGLQAKADKLKKAYKTGGPISEAEARELVKRDLVRNNAWTQMFLLEALVGPSVVCDAVIGELEAYSDKPWTDSGPETRVAIPGNVLRLGYLLLRLPEAERAHAIARLEALYKAWETGSNRFREATRNAIDVVLHGKEGAARSAYKPDRKNISTSQPLFVEGDPAWIEQTVRASGPPDASSTPDPRLAFLGGDAVLSLEIGWWKKYTKPGAQAQLVDRFGKIASPLILPFMLEMSATSKAKTSAAAWFRAHGAHTQAFLEKTAAGEAPASDWAKALLPKAS